ncbi:nitroreductase family protein [Neisseriaceae bacterium TC5R-5]|nr:nitroreductase family protein [Neisseriaceae bacterium TC5R-5]
MNTQFLTLSQARRTIYALNKQTPISHDAIENLIKEAIKHSPSAFNSQSSRAVILLGSAHEQLWDLTEDALRKIVPAEKFAPTEGKMAAFRAAAGTVLFYEDQQVIKGLQAQFAAYAEHFPTWSLEASGMAQFSVWTALAENKVGASLQHYNQLIEAAIQAKWQIPADWILRAQMPFGGLAQAAGDKTFIDDSERFKVFK